MLTLDMPDRVTELTSGRPTSWTVLWSPVPPCSLSTSPRQTLVEVEGGSVCLSVFWPRDDERGGRRRRRRVRRPGERRPGAVATLTSSSHPPCCRFVRTALTPARSLSAVQKLVAVVLAAATSQEPSHSLSLDELNAQSDTLLQSLKDVHGTIRQEILRHREPRTNERTVYDAREALQLTGLRSAVVRAHLDAMLAQLPAAESAAMEE